MNDDPRQAPGEDPEEHKEHEADVPLKRIDEDLDGSEETESFDDVEAGDSPGV